MGGRDHAELPGLVILKRLHHLVARIHDERPEPGDRLLDWEPAKDQHIECGSALVLMFRCLYDDAITGAVDRELTG